MKLEIIQYKSYLKNLSRKLRNNSTDGEVLLWQKIRRKQIKGYQFHRQRPINNYIVDFYCKDLKLVIEVDGSSHIGKEEADEIRQRKIESFGVKFLRFDDYDVKKNLNAVVEKIFFWIEDYENNLAKPNDTLNKNLKSNQPNKNITINDTPKNNQPDKINNNSTNRTNSRPEVPTTLTHPQTPLLRGGGGVSNNAQNKIISKERQ